MVNVEIIYCSRQRGQTNQFLAFGFCLSSSLTFGAYLLCLHFIKLAYYVLSVKKSVIHLKQKQVYYLNKNTYVSNFADFFNVVIFFQESGVFFSDSGRKIWLLKSIDCRKRIVNMAEQHTSILKISVCLLWQVYICIQHFNPESNYFSFEIPCNLHALPLSFTKHAKKYGLVRLQ